MRAAGERALRTRGTPRGTGWIAALCVGAVTVVPAVAQAAPLRPRATATLRVTKRVVAQPGVTDAGRFDLRAVGPAVTTVTNVGDGGTTGIVPIPAGPYLLSETARPGTNPADYGAAIACRDTAPGHTRSASSATTTLPIVVAPGDAWDCTITNTRRYAALALAVEGPATATAGTMVPYLLTATNVGTVAFPLARVAVSAPQCAPPGPQLQSVNSDATPATLDPGERWTYGCRVATTTAQNAVENVATATATDAAGRTAGATARAATALAPLADEQSTFVPQVAPLAVRSGRATLYGPRGCPVAVTTAFVKGRRIVEVTYFVDGRRVLRLTRANRAGHYTLRLRLRGLRLGPHRLSARIRFAGDSGTRTQTLRLGFVRCRGGAVTPSFTG